MSPKLSSRSIKTGFTLVFLALTASLLIALFLFNRFFLQSYYERDKVRVFTLAYNTLDRLVAVSEEEGSSLIDFVDSEYDSSLEDSPAISILRTLNEGSNIDIALMDASRTHAVSTSREANWISQKLYTYISLYEGSLNIVSDSGGVHVVEIPLRDTSFNDFSLDDFNFSSLMRQGEDYKLIRRNDHYIIHRVRDVRSGEEYIECFGIFSDYSTFFLMSSPLSNISEGVRIATRFMFITGIAVMIIGSCIVYLIVGRMTRPIMKLARLSDNLSRLDFSERYTGHQKNEIGVLGNSMNTMSDMLRAYIEELKNANERLQEDLREKIKVDEARKDFIANVSHELKTPLALIEGYAEGLSLGIAETTEQREYYCGVILDETKKMSRMVSELTSLISYEFGNEDIDITRFDLCLLVKSVTDSLGVKLSEAHAKVIFELPESAYLEADEFKIEEAYTNYLLNAINHLSGLRRIIVRIEKQGEKIRLSVYNDGERIPEESLDHLFEKFYKVDKARTRAYGGSGIGLSIVKAIIEAHGGSYGVENKENGVEFYFLV